MITLRRLDARAFKQLSNVDLAFPEHGALLIEGPNESGKSTLFEAIYFALYGAPLPREGDPIPLTALLPYDGRNAAVSLTLAVGATELEVRRTLTVGKKQVKHEARLLARRASGMPEEIYGAREVTDRVIQELHGLDGPALRNSYLIEQNALHRLETLSQPAREETIAKLLGLQRLVEVERELAPTLEEEAARTHLRRDFTLTQRRRRSREATTHASDLATQLGAARVHGLVTQRDDLALRHEEARQTHAAVTERIGALESRIARAGEISALLAALAAQESEVAEAQEVEARSALLRDQLAELERIEQTEIPTHEARLESLRATEADLAAADHAHAQVRLHARQARLAEVDDRLGKLTQLLPALDAHETARRDLAQAQAAEAAAQTEAEAQAAHDEAQAALTASLGHAQEAQGLVRQANLRDILNYWVRLKEVEQLRRGNEQIEDFTRERDTMSVQVERLQRRQVRAMIAVTLCFAALVAGGLAGYFNEGIRFAAWGVALVGFILVWVLGALYFITARRNQRAEKALRLAERKLTLSSIRSEAANLVGGATEDLPRVEDDLIAANFAVPASIEEGRAELERLQAVEPAALAVAQDRARDAMVAAERRKVESQAVEERLMAARRLRAERPGWAEVALPEIQRRLADSDQAVATTETTAQNFIVEPFTWPVERPAVEAAIAELTTQRANAAEELGDDATLPPGMDLAAAHQALLDAKAEEDRLSAVLEERLTALALPADPAAISAARGAAEADLARLREQTSERPELVARLDDLTTQHGALRGSLATSSRAALTTFAALLPLFVAPAAPNGHDTSAPEDLASAPPEDLAAITAHRDRLRISATATLEQLDERGAQQEIAEARAQVSVHEGRAAELDSACQDFARQAASLLAEHGVTAQGDESLDKLTTLWPPLGAVTGEEAQEIERALAEAERDAAFASGSLDELAAQAGYDAATVDGLDEAALQGQIEGAERDHRQRALAVSMAREARTRSVRRVLPEAEERMRSLLPALTASRYSDVRLLRGDQDPTIADLRIQVWDHAAGRFVGKTAFSGGANDQFSLALRLAFALATQPKDAEVVPGFLLLDEPMSAFDAERAQALAHLLTQGEVARRFPQVIVAAQRGAFDPAVFAAHARISAGAIEGAAASTVGSRAMG